MIQIPALAVVKTPKMVTIRVVYQGGKWISESRMDEEYALELARECEARGMAATVTA